MKAIREGGFDEIQWSGELKGADCEDRIEELRRSAQANWWREQEKLADIKVVEGICLTIIICAAALCVVYYLFS
jgi:hypothetical protein